MRIKCAAIECSGIIFTGRSHADIYNEQPKGSLDKGKQGFVTKCGKFVDRKEAAKIAFEAGQTKKQETILMSEDITGDWPWQKGSE